MFQDCCRRATGGDRTATSQWPRRKLHRPFFARSVHDVAPELIGATLLVDGVGGRIVEVEAYHHTDPAAHSFRGRTERNAVMFGPPGYAYVYRSYGIHWCLNFVCEPEGSASAVLIRAVEPTEGPAPRCGGGAGSTDERLLCSGPGRLCRGDGRDASRTTGSRSTGRRSSSMRATRKPEVAIGVRIGITKAAELPWRYGLKGSKFLSKPFKERLNRLRTPPRPSWRGPCAPP